ncbi:extracellular mutant protein 11-domain-containing protein [Durotheca rogersii]|uniref:extracellular mutant protein 11-domain-containing protein n=1 Tax=Durotheca rogersii TaxID=419775 RepID=UPI002220DB14|nr:extracellular mutant protein 11-domain-containing protein [Durotheca rogersii]KAI5868442.1 extracellular mutant protein 11-domain-containing protein [Durotheca rogersii]
MPPNFFLKQSKNKMQAWVTSSGVANGQGAPAIPGSGPAYDSSNHFQKRHVYLPQPAPPTVQAAQVPQLMQTSQTSQKSPPRSRAPIINANAGRAAAVTAARIPLPSSRTGHTRDASANMPRTRSMASEPVQSPQRPVPFWEGSTAEGSMFSDSASNADASTAVTSMYRMPFRAPSYQRGSTPHPGPIAKKGVNAPDQHPPFIIGPTGIIDVVGAPLTRSASTPDARKHHRGRLKGTSSPEPDDSEDSPYQTSPERTPSAKRLHHPKPLALLAGRRGSFSERAAYSQGDNVISPPPNRAPQGPSNDADEVRSEHSVHLKTKTQEPHRSTIFADTDTPMVSQRDESETESVDPQPTPKPVAKPKPQVSRQLFAKGSRARLGGLGGLHESPMPRPSAERRSSNPKRRHYELDYDDGALASMDYAELRREVFDFDPAQAEAQSAIGPPRGTLPEKLRHFIDKDQASQMEFFTKMPVNDWESSGDWFLERFGEIVQRFKDARQAKRSMVARFEHEIAERGEAVRNKIQGIDHTLSELKSEGEGMMSGKEFD